jgi:hypothetical protein
MFKYIYFIFFHFFLFLSVLKKFLIIKVFSCFFFPSFFPLRKIFVLFFSFLIWNFLCCFKKISSLVSHFFSTIFSFLKLVCSFWQIARLQEFFLPWFIPVTMQTQILQENGYCKIETLLLQENS